MPAADEFPAELVKVQDHVVSWPKCHATVMPIPVSSRGFTLPSSAFPPQIAPIFQLTDDYLKAESSLPCMGHDIPDNKYKPPYPFSTHIGAACCKQSRTFTDLAEKLKMNVLDLMRQCSGHASPSKTLIKGLAKELDISESYLEKLAEEVRKDLG
jgi:hypothetical protein